MQKELLTEEQFMSTISSIASKHGCRFIDIVDVTAVVNNKIVLIERIINFDGTPESEYACTIELGDVFKKYDIEQPIANYKEDELGTFAHSS
ncbi:hypothetical protein KAJ61_04405 [Candidatus Parcubacteria bacterium]|nr:hypothetical protein [Candidatus Parcubacteria bacterium]